MPTQPEQSRSSNRREPEYKHQNVLLKLTSDSWGSRVTCSLLSDAFGLPEGTAVSVRIGSREQELWRFREGAQHGHDTLGQNVIVVAKACRLSKNSHEGKYPEIVTHSLCLADPNWSPEQVSSRYTAGFINAGPGRIIDIAEGKYKLIEPRNVVLNDEASEAFSFSGEEDFIKKATEWLNVAGRDGTLMVRQTDIADLRSGNNRGEETSVKSLRIGWNRKEERPMTVEESISLFLHGDSNNSPWQSMITSREKSDKEIFLDAIPIRHAPSKKIYTDVNECDRRMVLSRHEARHYQYRAARNSVERLFTKGVIIYENMGKKGKAEDETSTQFFPTDLSGPLYKISELPGCRTSDIQAVFDARAAKRYVRPERDLTLNRSAMSAHNDLFDRHDVPINQEHLRERIAEWKSRAVDNEAHREAVSERNPKFGL